MKIYLEPKGWPVSAQDAPSGLCARFRKGKVILYFKLDNGKESQFFDAEGNQTLPSGLLQSVEVKTEEK